MRFVVYWTFSPAHRNEANERFKATCGPAPKGVKVIGRWHSLAGGEGFCVWETVDPLALGKWAQEWSDLLSFRIFPVAGDEGIGKVIA